MNEQRHEARTTVRALCANTAELLGAFASHDEPRIAICTLDDGRYIQFWAKHNVAVAEVVSNTFLTPNGRWTWLQERDLIEAGWSAPDEESPNWHFVRRGPRAYWEVSRSTVHALTRVLGYGNEHALDPVLVTTFTARGRLRNYGASLQK